MLFEILQVVVVVIAVRVCEGGFEILDQDY
jgi:hypothetical protein